MRSSLFLAAALVLLPLAARAASPLPLQPNSIEPSRFDIHFQTKANTGDAMDLIPSSGRDYDIVICSLSLKDGIVVDTGKTGGQDIKPNTCATFWRVNQASLRPSKAEPRVAIFIRLLGV